MIGADLSAVQGMFVKRLLLPCHQIMPFFPFIGVGIYILTSRPLKTDLW